MKIKTWLIATVAMLAISFTTSAQIKHTVDVKSFKDVKPNTRFVDSDQDKFVGTWLYEANGDQITLTFNKIYVKFGSNELEALRGGYIYKKNGVEVGNTMTTKPLHGSHGDLDGKMGISIPDEANYRSVGYKVTRFNINVIGDTIMTFTMDEKPREGVRADEKFRFLSNKKFRKQ